MDEVIMDGPTSRLRTAALPERLAATIVFLASAAVLVLEILGLRLVAPYVGITLQTSSAVIGVALGAIAYGAWTGGWLADRVDPGRLLPAAFGLAALASALTLPIVRWAGEVLRGGAAGATLLLTALAVFVPAAALSAVTPLVVKTQLADVDRTGRVVGRFSGIGTLGAITATLGTGFVLVAALPTSTILLGLAALLGLTALGLAAYLRRSGGLSGSLQPAPALAGGPRRRPGAPGRSSRVRGRAARASLLTVACLAGAGLIVWAPDPCDVETAYHCARIVGDPKRPGGRLLLLNSARHSYVDLADPRHLEFAYTQWIGAYVDTFAAAGRPVRALHLGGGGFTLPRYLSATRPGSVNRVLELDGGLVELNRSRLGMVPGPELRIAVGDARTLMAGEPAGDYDLVVGDAFGHLAVPWHLTTTEFVAGVRRVLRSGGSYVLNVIDYPPGRLIRAELATIRAVFSYVALVAPARAIAGEVGANFVIIASTAPLNLTGLAAGLARLPEPVRLLSDGPPASGGGVPATGGGAAGTGRHASELDAYVAGAGVLTDDYAPVDQLLSAP